MRLVRLRGRGKGNSRRNCVQDARQRETGTFLFRNHIDILGKEKIDLLHIII